MKEMIYTNKIDDEIILHEHNMLAVYLKKTKEYLSRFEEKGYSLKLGLMWRYSWKRGVMYQRVKFRNGYMCYVYCSVQKDGVDVNVPSFDGEVDYYPVSTVWMITAIFRGLNMLRPRVTLCEDTYCVDEDLNGFLSQLNSLENAKRTMRL